MPTCLVRRVRWVQPGGSKIDLPEPMKNMSIPLPPPLTYLVPLYASGRQVGHVSSAELLLHSDLSADELRAVKPKAKAAFNALRWQDPSTLTDANTEYMDMVEELVGLSIDLTRFDVEDLPEAMRLLVCAWTASRVADAAHPLSVLRLDGVSPAPRSAARRTGCMPHAMPPASRDHGGEAGPTI